MKFNKEPCMNSNSGRFLNPKQIIIQGETDKTGKHKFVNHQWIYMTIEPEITCAVRLIANFRIEK